MMVLENSIAFFNRIYVLYFSGYAYEASAHLVQIWCRGSLHSSFNKNYVYTHVSYLHPEIILRNSNVCLHSVTSTMALFAIAKHSVDIFNFNKYVENLDRNMIFKAQYETNLWTKFLNSNSSNFCPLLISISVMFTSNNFYFLSDVNNTSIGISNSQKSFY